MLRQQIAKGFIRNPSKFTNDFEDLTKTTMLDPLASISQHCKIEISEDESENQSDNEKKKPVSLLRRSNMIEIEEKDFPKSTALRMSTMNMFQVVEDEEENGLIKSYTFEKPEESDNTSIMTEILEEPELPQKRRLNSKFSTIQSMLHSLGLGRYVLNFETKGIDAESFIDMTDEQLKEVGIPKKVREKIMDSKISGDWQPIVTNSIVFPNEEESKTTTKKSTNPDIKIDPHFVIEQGNSKPADKIEVMLAET